MNSINRSSQCYPFKSARFGHSRESGISYAGQERKVHCRDCFVSVVSQVMYFPASDIFAAISLLRPIRSIGA